MSTVHRPRTPQRTQKSLAPRSSRLESLEPRRVLAAPTLADLPSEINIAAGAPVHLALGGQDADGDDLTYTVTSDNSDISASIPKQESASGNRSMRITVQGYGEMVFELFEGRAPETTTRIIEIAESDWYDDRIFHRVIDGFMIQGGSRDGLGLNGTGTQFDDEYHPDLQFTTSGLLAMAKSGDDTNDSQFFITDIPTGGFTLPRWLDFNHTIFGMLTEGESVRQAISEAATDSNDRPTSDIVIESVEIFQDNQNAVMVIGSADGVLDSGEVTVTVSDGNGGTATKTITVNVLADSENNNPFLAPIDPISLEIDQPYSFQLEATDVEGDQIYYQAELLTETDDVEVEVTDTGLVTITPKNGVVGVVEIAFRVGPTEDSLIPDGTDEYQESIIDTQIVVVEIPPATPDVSFSSGTDTGAQDGSTARDNSDGKEIYFRVGNLEATSTLKVYLQGVETDYLQVSRIPQGDGSDRYVATIQVLSGATLDDGDYTLHVQQLVDLGDAYDNQLLPGELSEPFEFSVDTTAPVITSEAVDIAMQGEEYFYDVESDSEGDPEVYYEIQIPIPDGMVQNADTGEIYWTPDGEVGFEQPVVVLVHDGAGNVGRQEFNITIYAPLRIEFEGDTSVDELETVSLIVSASDPSNPSTSLTISLQDGVLPADAAYSLEPLDANRARFTWHTTEADGPGVYDLVFSATDNANALSRQSLQITVAELNEAPEFTEVFDSWTGTEDERIDLQFAAADSDLPANELVFDLIGDVPEGAAIDASTGLLSWTPGEDDGGQSYEFSVRVTDSGGLSAEHTLVIRVDENQKGPIFDPTPPQQVVEGELLEFTVVAHDGDIPARDIAYRLEGSVPEGLSIDADTGRVTWQVPDGYLPADSLAESLELTVVAREVAVDSEPVAESTQIVEITVVDGLADLVAATLTLPETGVSDPLAGPGTISLLSALNANNLPRVAEMLPMDESYDSGGFFGQSFFGTRFGTTGDGVEVTDRRDGESEEGGDDAPSENEQGSSLDRFLDEIAGELGEVAVEALVAVTQAQSEESADPAEFVSAPEPERVRRPSEEPAEAAETEVRTAEKPDGAAQAAAEAKAEPEPA